MEETEGSGGGAIGLDAPIEISRDWKPPSMCINGGSIAERRAARCGFNAPRINTARFRSISPLSSPSVHSPYLTIPSGISPTTLLDSPVMLPNSQAQPSPTTGTFPLPSLIHGSTMPISSISNSEKDKGEDADSPFMFKPHLDAFSLQCLSGAENQDMGMDNVNHQVLVPVQPQVDFECQAGFLNQKVIKNSPSDIEVSNGMIVNSKCIALQTLDSGFASDQAPQNEEQLHVEDTTGSQQLLEGDQREAYLPMAIGKPSEDGYNWRKYGQKQVKGSEFPRSYYKCTHPNCQVKKKIERSHDGQITEIIYKGAHNHPKPQPSRRSALGSAFPFNEISETGEGSGSYVNKFQGGYTWRSTLQGSKDIKVSSDWVADGLERTSSTSVLTEHSDPLSTAQGKHLDILESADTPELSSTLASHNEDEDRTTQGSISLGEDDDDESESKRRKRDCGLIETNLVSRAAREPRVVVQTDSEVDILDDGYRWRKYGQKVVKGNPNPRSYYKCTSAGCSVRKHVERASHDLKYVITTYEGKHNHEVPAARNSSHVNSTNGNVLPSTTNAQATLNLPRNTNAPKPEPQVQDFVPHFERKPNLSNDFFKPINLGELASDMKFGAMKLPPFQTAMPSFGGFNANHSEALQSASIAHIASEFPITLPMNLPLSTNLAMSGFNFNSIGKRVCPTQTYLGEQQPKEADMRFLRPKQERKDETVFETPLPIDHLAGVSSSIYPQIMRGFPL